MRRWRSILLGAIVAVFAFTAPLGAATILMVTDASGSLTSNESSYKSYLESLGYTVTTVWDNASQATIDAAWAAAHCVYVPYSVTDWELGDKLRLCTKGIVCEERYLDDNHGLSTQPGWDTSSYTAISITDNTHYITSPFSVGSVTIFSSSQPMTLMNPTHASGLRVLAEQHFGNKALAVVDTGATLANTVSGNSTAAGRRVHLPWGGDTFNIASLNSNAQTIGLRAIEWAIGDLLLHLKLNEASGTTAADSSNFTRNGTVTGTATWIAGRRQNAFDFNGATKIQVNSLLGNPGSFTLACWARIDAADSSGAEAISVGDYLTLRLHDAGTGGPTGSFYAGASTWRSVSVATSYIGRGWHHFAVTFDDATNNLRLWIDGVNVATTSTTSSVNWSGLGTTTRVGQHGNTGTTWDLDGAIDDVRVYSKALSQSEIADLYGLVGHWKLTETSGTSAADSSGKALNGTYANGPTLAQAGPYPSNGQYATSFDGVNDVVTGAASTNYTSFADGFSVAGWVYFNAFQNNVAMLENGSTTDSLALAFSASGQVRVQARNTSNSLQSMTTTATLPLGSWKHVVGTYNGSAFRVYIDGQLASTTNSAFTIGTPSGNLSLGASPQGTAEYLNGRLHDVRLYNRALAAEEVSELYGLVGQWKLDELAGTSAADSSGQGATGTYTNGPTLGQTGAYDYAITADGSDDYVSASETNSQRVSNGVAISAWVWPVATSNATRMIVNKEGEYELALTATGEVQWALANTTPGWNWHATGATVPNNRWSHVAVSYEGDVVKTYVNGLLKEAYSGSGSIGDAHVSLNDLRIGGRSNNPASQYFAGRLDEVRVYNRPLSTLEVAALSGLWGHWTFDEGTGTSIADSSGFANNAVFGAGSPNWVSGIYSGGLEFDGPSDDAISTSKLTPPSEGTVALWFRSDGAPASRQRLWGAGADYEMWQDPDGFVSCDVATDGYQGGFITTTPLTTAGRWYHLAVVYDSDDDTYKIYLNGELHKSGISSWNITQQASNYISFGTRTGSTERFDGALDDFRIYNRKLSSSEIYELFGLIAWYKLDETTGTVAADSTGLGNDGTYSGSPTLNVSANGAPSQGTAVAFNGTNSVQVSGLYEKSTSVSAAAWVRLDGVDTLGAEVISLGDYFTLRLNSGGSGAQARYYNGSTWISSTASQVILSTGWHHFAAVLDGGNTLKLYVDGVEASSAAATGAISYTGQGANSRIATHGNGGTTTDLTGRVDDVRVFKRAMKPDEAFQLYRGSRINGIKILQWVEAR